MGLRARQRRRCELCLASIAVGCLEHATQRERALERARVGRAGHRPGPVLFDFVSCWGGKRGRGWGEGRVVGVCLGADASFVLHGVLHTRTRTHASREARARRGCSCCDGKTQVPWPLETGVAQREGEGAFWRVVQAGSTVRGGPLGRHEAGRSIGRGEGCRGRRPVLARHVPTAADPTRPVDELCTPRAPPLSAASSHVVGCIWPSHPRRRAAAAVQAQRERAAQQEG